MPKRNKMTLVTLWINRGIAGTVGVLMIFLPALLDWYSGIRPLSANQRMIILGGFYLCCIAVFLALWNMDRLLTAILRGEVFSRPNVGRIRRIQGCCGAVCLICIPVACAYLPIVFLAVIMAFLCLSVGVLASVMDAAVTIREENDLTI